MASEKPTPVYAAVFFAFTTIAMLVFALMANSGAKELEVELAKSKDNEAKTKGAWSDQNAAVRRLKELLGSTAAELGDDTEEATVIADLLKDLRETNGDPTQTEATVSGQLRQLRRLLSNERLTSDNRQKNLNGTSQSLTQLQMAKQAEIDRHLARVSEAEADLRAKEQTHTEELTRKDDEINSLTEINSDLQATLAAREQELKDARDEFDQRIGKLTAANNKLRRELDEFLDVSFEVADGKITHVDHRRGLVYINIGEVDKLKVRTTFSVYAQNNKGIARYDKEDIKGKIEVTRLVEPHLAEARILDADLYRPIAAGDQVYSPIFSVGMTEKFSLVGLIDLDGDGRSDRDLLHTIISSNGGEVDNEVNDKGEVTGTGISVETTFLVVGKIPDGGASGDINQDQYNQLIREAEGSLKTQAREQGVRIISLTDFRDWMGYSPRRRLFAAGDGEYNLKGAGSLRGANGGQALESSGNVAGGNKRLGPPSGNLP